MRSFVKSVALFAARTVAICLIALLGITCPFSCTMDEGAIKIVKNEYDSPTLESVEVTGARTVALTFSKAVEAINAYVCKNENGEATPAQCSESEEVLTVTAASDLEIGKQYVIGGRVKDGGGNTLTFALPVLGFNSNPATVVISAVHPKYEKDSKAGNFKDEFIQLYTLRGGNLSGFTVHTGKLGTAKLVLPAVGVKAGEIVTVHFQALEDGCKDEDGEDKSIASSRYSSPKVRDVWAYLIDYTKSADDAWVKNTATNCLGESDEVVLIKNGRNLLDAVLYAAAGTDEWKNDTYYDLAEEAVEEGLWAGDSPADAIVLDRAMTAATILKRNGCASLTCGGTADRGDWAKTSFAKKIEQKVLASLDADEIPPSGGGGGGNIDGEDEGEDEEDGGNSGGSSSGSGGGGSSGGGNSGHKAALPLPAPKCTGDVPRVIICSVHPAYTSATDSVMGKVYKEEFIQLFALKGGNLSHLTVSTGKLGSANFYPLSDADVSAGEIITVHLRRVGEGCTNETGSELFLAGSWYSCDEVRDVWIDNVYDPATKKGAAALDRNEDAVAVFCGQDKVMMDAVLYSVAGTAQWKSADTNDIAQAAQKAGVWTSASPLQCITVESKFTPATILQRGGCRKLQKAAQNGTLPSVIIQSASEWKKKPFGKAVEQQLLSFVD